MSRDRIAEHTPGPWRAFAGGRAVYAMTNAGTVLVADVGEGSAANASLIASAPALLAALEPFAALLQPHNDEGADERRVFGVNDALITVGDLRRAVAAVAAARGRK